MPKVKINNKEIEIEEGKTILDAAKRAGIEIPTLCYHPLLEPYAACRICIVEVKKGEASEIVTSCNTKIKDGMEIYTNSEKVQKERNIIFELLLAQAPAAEELLELAKKYGVEKTRFEIKDPNNKCILCGLCVRACQNVVKANAIGFENRGRDRKVVTPYEEYSEKCINCGACTFFCPTSAVTMEDVFGRKVIHTELMLGPAKAIRVPFLAAVPNVPFIDKENCIHFKTDGCQLCVQACTREAINHEMEEEEEEIEVGTIILATGYDLMNPKAVENYGYGKFNNVITSLEFEHLCHASGPTGGKILTTEGKEPESIAIVHCVGSRDKNYHEYCSKICCMYAMKFSHLVKEKTKAHIYEFYIDIRSGGKGYEEFYRRILEEGTTLIRGRVAEITDVALTDSEKGKLVIRCEDTLAGVIRRIPVEMVVLCPAIVPRHDAEEVAKIFGIGCGNDKFYREQHPKLGPVSTVTEGIFIAGTCQGPKDIPESIAQGAGAAGAVMSLGQTYVIEPIYAVVDEKLCAGCKLCIAVCPFNAITRNEEKKIAEINMLLCKGCGTCVATCPSGANYQKGYRDQQITAELEGALA
jgi:heterodisulfide reductase subunit A